MTERKIVRHIFAPDEQRVRALDFAIRHGDQSESAADVVGRAAAYQEFIAGAPATPPNALDEATNQLKDLREISPAAANLVDATATAVADAVAQVVSLVSTPKTPASQNLTGRTREFVESAPDELKAQLR